MRARKKRRSKKKRKRKRAQGRKEKECRRRADDRGLLSSNTGADQDSPASRPLRENSVCHGSSLFTRVDHLKIRSDSRLLQIYWHVIEKPCRCSLGYPSNLRYSGPFSLEPSTVRFKPAPLPSLPSSHLDGSCTNPPANSTWLFNSCFCAQETVGVRFTQAVDG